MSQQDRTATAAGQPAVSIDITDQRPAPAPAASPAAELPRVVVTNESGIDVMRFPRGKIDGNAVREMYESAVQVTDKHAARLLVDLAGVDMVSSGAMGMLVTIKKRCLGSGAQLQVVAADPLVMQSFRVMRLDAVLTLHATAEAAKAAFKD